MGVSCFPVRSSLPSSPSSNSGSLSPGCPLESPVSFKNLGCLARLPHPFLAQQILNKTCTLTGFEKLPRGFLGCSRAITTVNPLQAPGPATALLFWLLPPCPTSPRRDMLSILLFPRGSMLSQSLSRTVCSPYWSRVISSPPPPPRALSLPRNLP